MTKKILILALHRPGRSPGQRYRFESFLPYMAENGFDYELSFLLDKESDKLFYRPGNYFGKALLVARTLLQRWKDARRAKQFDLVFLYRDAHFLGTSFFEKKIRRSGTPMLFDFDDAIWIRDVSEGNKRLSFLKNPDKIPFIISICDRIMAGNQYLAAYARQFNAQVEVLPSVIDTDAYYVPQRTVKDRVCIGWTGSPTTRRHFEMILPVLLMLKEKYRDRVVFRLIGDEHYECLELGLKGEKWSAETEVADLAGMDIGIMPLPDEEWSKGKCSMKGLQYMGMGMPTVMSAVGMNREVIEDGVNGFLAGSDEEWGQKLSLLIENADLRAALGSAARKTIEERYSIRANQKKFFNLLTEASNS